MMNVKNYLRMAAQKNHFEDYQTAIRHLIFIIEFQQKQIDELMLDKNFKKCQEAQENELKKVLNGGK